MTDKLWGYLIQALKGTVLEGRGTSISRFDLRQIRKAPKFSIETKTGVRDGSGSTANRHW